MLDEGEDTSNTYEVQIRTFPSGERGIVLEVAENCGLY